MEKFKILLYEEMHEVGKALLREKGEITFAKSYEESSLIEEAKEMDGIIIRANGKASRKVMDSAPRLKVIGRHGVGVENIDLEAATEKGIWVVNTPDANDISVAEHFFGLARSPGPVSTYVQSCILPLTASERKLKSIFASHPGIPKHFHRGQVSP